MLAPGTIDVAAGASNRYVVCLRTGEIVPWGPPFDAQRFSPECQYIGDILGVVEDCLPDLGLRFVVTWSVDRLPFYGKDVVAVVLGDEWSRWPRYCHRVGAVFKTMGFWPELVLPSWDLGSSLVRAMVLQYLRIQAKGARGRVDWLRWRLTPADRRTPIDTIPMGVCNVVPAPRREWSERRIDVAFYGSILHGENHRRGLRRLVGSPKLHARKEMLAAVDALRARRPELRIEVGITEGFVASESSDARSYSMALGDTKLALAPRGTHAETYRFFEGHFLGCVVISEDLPRHSFYADPTLVRLGRWEELGALVDRFFSDAHPELGPEAQRRSAQRWDDVLSPQAIGRRTATILRRRYPDRL